MNEKTESFIAAVSDRVDCGARFAVDFAGRTLRIDGKHVDIPSEALPHLSEEEALAGIQRRYDAYRHSVPSERSESRRRSYFKALPEAALTDEDMMYGLPRETARCRLEVFVLLLTLGGLAWNDEWGSWFWQSPHDKSLILLRSWVEPGPGKHA